MSSAPTRVRSGPATADGSLAARNRAVERHLSLAVAVARRYRGRGIPLEDLVQVASVGLIHAVDRYDQSRNVEFKAFAVPTIAGEIKRYFRDQGWHLRVPRRLQDLALRARRAEPELTQRLGRMPTAADLATHLGEPERDVAAALAVGDAYRALSIDAPVSPDQDLSVESMLGGDADPDLESADVRVSVRGLLARLPRPERRVVWLRYFRGLTQAEIAATLGMSQTGVSRSLARSLRWLRDCARTGGAGGGAAAAA